MKGKPSFSSGELGRLRAQMSLSHSGCPLCGNPVSTVKRKNRLDNRCFNCGWEGPEVTSSGIKGFDESYY